MVPSLAVLFGPPGQARSLNAISPAIDSRGVNAAGRRSQRKSRKGWTDLSSRLEARGDVGDDGSSVVSVPSVLPRVKPLWQIRF